ncbi:MAG TPA: class I tRNA ligase family protein, partial [Candidatus Limnocylindria bacterium]|nr:class I tRNA ligase family protein [Candidatus Limnocylindria bacterium]
YPTAVLSTGFDIIFFWVARMAMMGLHFMKEVPFRDVYIHALVRDAEGQKMSKSKGNVVDPLEVMTKYGTDAFRFTLAALAAQGRDIRISEDRVEGYRNFANKLWNASRFVLANLDGYDARAARRAPVALPDRWIASRLAETARAVRTHLSRYRFNDAAGALYQFVWHELCDWYLEAAKPALYGGDPARRLATQHTLVTTLEATLRLLHPFMPFITEELWQRLPGREARGASIMIAPYPKPVRRKGEAGVGREMAIVMDTVTAIRTIRGEMRVSPALTLAVTVKPAPAHDALLREHAALIQSLARATLTVDAAAARAKGAALGVVGESELYVDLSGAVDLAAERERLTKEIKRAEEAIGVARAKLGRPDFTERAPAEIVAKERDRLAQQEALRAKLVASLAWVE